MLNSIKIGVKIGVKISNNDRKRVKINDREECEKRGGAALTPPLKGAYRFGYYFNFDVQIITLMALPSALMM